MWCVTDDYLNKVRGCWIGKNIGGTLGGPLEGKQELMSYSFYPNLSKLPLPNDDLDLQLVWLHALETHGPRLTAEHIAQEWVEHVFFPYDEYGYSLTNMRRGLHPPVSGWFGNPFIDCMGSPIRSEIWGLVAPGQPDVAAWYAYNDAITDHAGGEGVYGEVFFAVIEAAAFMESSPTKLIELGLSYIPAWCRVAAAVNATCRWWKQGLTWEDTRKRIIKRHGCTSNFTDAPQNIAFTILGWLYGNDFGDCLCKAVNCGYDTDCTGATLGAILGILHGANALPAKWVEPIGDSVVVSPPVKGFLAPKTIAELTDRTAKVAQEVAAYWSNRKMLNAKELTTLNSPMVYEYHLPEANTYNGLEITVSFSDNGPAVWPDDVAVVEVLILNRTEINWVGDITLETPNSPKTPEELVQPGELGDEFVMNAPESFALVPHDVFSHRMYYQPDTEQPLYNCNIKINQYHNSHLWKCHRIPLTFVLGYRFKVQLPNGLTCVMYSSDGQVPFQHLSELPDGIYRVSTTLVCPTERDTRLMIGTASPARVYLNKKMIWEEWQWNDRVSAYHRGRGAVTHLCAGKNSLEIELEKVAGKSFDLRLAATATKQVEEPGSYFSYIDIMWGTQCDEPRSLMLSPAEDEEATDIT